ncbi:MAG: type II toxin-antitoxin system VapC family toxin [Bifidobacteriaceae bacterium]|nr:type II toxin-antitoxin system VapC family toxin [Bifidobacteriaceae bacterium]
MVDASAWVLALLDSGAPGLTAKEEMIRDPHWTAPAHALLEVIRTIRRYRRQELVSSSTEEAAVQAVIEAEVEYWGAEDWLLQASWDLRHNLSIYDAPYVAIALRLRAPLVTGDLRLAAAASAAGARVVPVTSSDEA